MLNRTKMQLTVIIFPWLQLFGVLPTTDRKGAYCAPITTQKGKEFFNICHIYDERNMKSYDMSKGKTSLLDWILNATALHCRNKGEDIT